MNTYIQKLRSLWALGLVLLIVSCGDDDSDLSPVTVNFTNTALGVQESVEVGITFSRAAEADGSLTLNVAGTTLQYGESLDYYTNPATVNGALTLNYEVGDNTVTFTVFEGTGLNIEQDETITMTLTDNDNVAMGNNLMATLTFAENFIAPNGRLTMDAGGPEFPQHAFVDLSKQEFSRVTKDNWDLAFLNEGFHVTLNATNQVMARSVDKTNLADVIASDTTGFAAAMVAGPTSSLAARAWVDNSSGDLDSTAIAPISANTDENNVYIIKREGDNKNWKKVKIDRSGDNYVIRFADINSTTFEEVTIIKSNTHNAVFFNLDNEIVDFEPEKSNWDFMYGTYITFSTFGQPIPYSFGDFIVINRENTSVATVMEDENTSFENFDDSSLASLTFRSDLNVIGSTWRSVFPPSVFEDRFYVIKDSEGNHYKVEFESLFNEMNERGFVTFEYELL